nr:hypothetical protein [Streptomyces samsunensis]
MGVRITAGAFAPPRVTMQKLAPYQNVDRGTMNPFQHGEVLVIAAGTDGRRPAQVHCWSRAASTCRSWSLRRTTAASSSSVVSPYRRPCAAREANTWSTSVGRGMNVLAGVTAR